MTMCYYERGTTTKTFSKTHNMEKINHEKHLIEKLKADIDNYDKKTIVLIGGHFPLLYLEEGAVESIRKWGEFSTYTLELACKVGVYAKTKGKNIKFAFFADDHSYESLATYGNPSRRRKWLYKEKSREDAKLHPIFQAILKNYGFSEQDAIRHDHGKQGREDCLYFSEKVLRASLREIENSCAREYTAFIEDPNYFDKETCHIVSFMPNRCQGNICNFALDREIQDLSASHIFIDTMNIVLTREELFTKGAGVTYQRDTQLNKRGNE